MKKLVPGLLALFAFAFALTFAAVSGAETPAPAPVQAEVIPPIEGGVTINFNNYSDGQQSLIGGDEDNGFSVPLTDLGFEMAQRQRQVPRVPEAPKLPKDPRLVRRERQDEQRQAFALERQQRPTSAKVAEWAFSVTITIGALFAGLLLNTDTGQDWAEAHSTPEVARVLHLVG